MAAKKSQREEHTEATDAAVASKSDDEPSRGFRAYAELINAQNRAWIDYTRRSAEGYSEWAKSVREADLRAWKPVEEAYYAYLQTLTPFFDKESYRRHVDAAEKLRTAQSEFLTSDERREARRAATDKFEAAQREAAKTLRERYAEAYRRYLKAIKDAWADLDTDAIDFGAPPFEDTGSQPAAATA